MTDKYIPPFTMNEEITNMVIEIGELVGQLTVYDDFQTNLKLRRENRIKTIHSSLAIENNTLTIEQVTDVINGRKVLAPPQDIHEVKNAYEAYEELQKMNPYSIKDLLKAHKFMMSGLVREAGVFRSGNVGVYSGDVLIHAGSPANYVPELMKDLFSWLKSSKLHPLIKGCIFHYEFEFIHPFADGNGRTGRLWHSLILQKWKPFFAWLPIETMIYDNQEKYYEAINKSNSLGESTEFVRFMLKVIQDTLSEIVKTKTGKSGYFYEKNMGVEEKLLVLLTSDGKISARTAAEILDVSQRQIERCIAALKKSGRLKRIGANRNGSWIVVSE